MQTLASFLTEEHIKDLQREADADRLARLATPEQTGSALRRQVGNGARRLSAALDDFATQLDPAACRTSYSRPSYGRE